jgi:excisionase family DNA binding protein
VKTYPSENQRLASAFAGLAATITELIDARCQKVGELLEQKAASQTFEKFLTRKQVAELFQVSVRTIENWTHDGRLPYIKISSEVRYPYSDLMTYFKNQNAYFGALDTLKPR